jgi:hypothetical protein
MLLKGKSALLPHQNWLEKANFLWENEKMPEFYKEKALNFEDKQKKI